MVDSKIIITFASQLKNKGYMSMNKVLKVVYDDGGRSKYFKAQGVGDCVTRAIAIAAEMDYKEVYNLIYKVSGKTPRNGVARKAIKEVMKMLGFEWVPTMKVGQGVKVHLRENEVPMDKRIICSCSCHLVSVINGTIHDTYDCTRDGMRAVYGYWIVK